MCEYPSSWKYSPQPVLTSTKELQAAAHKFIKSIKDFFSCPAKFIRVQCQCHTFSFGQHLRISVPAYQCSTCNMGTSSSTPAPPPTPVVGSGSVETTSTESTGFHTVEFHGTSFSEEEQQTTRMDP